MEQYSFVNTFDKQNIILSYLHPWSVYRSLIICYKVGTGKTYASACLSELYLLEGFKVLYISNSRNSIENFKNEYNKVITDSKLKNLIKNVSFMSFTKMYGSEFKDIYGLIILDEIHNLRENAKRYLPIKEHLENAKNAKILAMSATPMIDSADELDSIYKIIGEEKIIFSSEEDPKKMINVDIKYIGSKVGNQFLYLSKMEGLQLEKYKEALSINDSVYTLARQTSISVSETYDETIELKYQSSKIKKFIDNIQPNKLTVVFCFYIKRGINFLAQVLESLGYTEWEPNNVSDTKKYAIINGETGNTDVGAIIDEFNSLANIEGKRIHILIGSSVLSESITLFNVRELHILSPFWNYGQIDQSIGRTIRYGSHSNIKHQKDRNIKIYLHAACDEEGGGQDIDMWKIAYSKKCNINDRLDKAKIENKEYVEYKNLNIPDVDNNMVFKIDNTIWDLRNCFDSNPSKISWCNIYYENIVVYDIVNNKKVLGVRLPANLKINKPLDTGITIWRSCVDNKLRITINEKKGKFRKRGKILNNMISKEIQIVSAHLNCSPNIEEIILKLKSDARYFDKQIEYTELNNVDL